MVTWAATQPGAIVENLLDVPRDRPGLDLVLDAVLAASADISITWAGTVEIAVAQVHGGVNLLHPAERTLGRFAGKRPARVWDRYGEGQRVSEDLTWVPPLLVKHIYRALSYDEDGFWIRPH